MQVTVMISNCNHGLYRIIVLPRVWYLPFGVDEGHGRYMHSGYLIEKMVCGVCLVYYNIYYKNEQLTRKHAYQCHWRS